MPSPGLLEAAHDAEHTGMVPDFIRLINNGAMSQAACVAAELGVADLLATGPKFANELANATGCHGPSLHRLLRALSTVNLCCEAEDGAFALTPLGSLLRSDAPNSLRSWAILCGKYLRPLWGNLLHSVKTGESAGKLLGQTDCFNDLEADEQATLIFNRAMAELTTLLANEVVRLYRFDDMTRIVDVGGGYGALLAAVLQSYPAMTGMLLDLPHTIEGARRQLAVSGLAKRCQLVAGNFFHSVPAGADAYLLKAVLHDWDDEKCRLILCNCRRAVSSNGRILLIERILPVRFEACWLHHAIARMDLTALVGLDGRERTEAEFRDLLNATDFQITKVIQTSLEYSIMEAVPC
jgi:orsellinic acid C2-O-methyltransferase